VGIDPQTKAAPQTVQEQTKQVLENMKAVLTTAGLTMQDIVKTTIYVTDMGNFAAVNDVYVTYFDQPRPARGTVGVAELPRVGGDTPILVEIEAVAMKGNE
jgi:2-iminobutanoate/2-iminopropanoate deaminase